MSKNMRLISSLWEQQPTFRLIPVTTDCPFVEIIYDPANKVLALLSKDKKEGYHFLPKLDDNGDILKVKPGKIRPNKQPYQEQRVLLATYYEYFINNEDEISDFVVEFSTNCHTFDYKKYFTILETKEDESYKSEVSVS